MSAENQLEAEVVQSSETEASEPIPQITLERLFQNINERLTLYNLIGQVIRSEKAQDIQALQAVFAQALATKDEGLLKVASDNLFSLQNGECLPGTPDSDQLQKEVNVGVRTTEEVLMTIIEFLDTPARARESEPQDLLESAAQEIQAETEIVVFQQDQPLTTSPEKEKPKTETFLEKHPPIRKLMDMKVDDDESPWTEAQGSAFIPITYIVKLFKVREDYPHKYNLYQAIDQQLKRWSKKTRKEDLVVSLGPKQKSIKKEEVLGLLMFIEGRIEAKDFPFGFANGNLPFPTSAPKQTKEEPSNGRHAIPEEPEVVTVYSMKSVVPPPTVVRKSGGKFPPKRRVAVGPRGSQTESSMRNSNAWLSRPRPPDTAPVPGKKR